MGRKIEKLYETELESTYGHNITIVLEEPLNPDLLYRMGQEASQQVSWPEFKDFNYVRGFRDGQSGGRK